MLPIIGITMGDPAGVGPEVIAKALAHGSVYEICRPVVIGDAKRLALAAEIVKLSKPIRSISRRSGSLLYSFRNRLSRFRAGS